MTTELEKWPAIDEAADKIAAILANAKEVTCLAHKDADADSLGSALAFALTLRQMGKVAHVVVPEPLPRLLAHLPGFDTVSTTAPASSPVLFAFDCATVGRFGEKGELIGQATTVVNIDHHITNTAFGTVNLIAAQASATGQVLYRLFSALGWTTSSDAATNLYAAILTDTGGFRHENTTEEVLRIASDLVKWGADPGFVALKSYKSRTVAQLRLEASAVSTMRAEIEGGLIWSEVTQEMLSHAGADMQYAEGIIDQLQSIDTMKIALLIKEVSPSITKISVRSRDTFDATDLCIPFGGGGHRRAAGAEIKMPLAQARDAVLAVARDLFTS